MRTSQSQRPKWMTRIGWFVLLWVAGVGAVGIAALLLRGLFGILRP